MVFKIIEMLDPKDPKKIVELVFTFNWGSKKIKKSCQNYLP